MIDEGFEKENAVCCGLWPFASSEFRAVQSLLNT